MEAEMRCLCQEIVVDGAGDLKTWKDKLNTQIPARVKGLLAKLKIAVTFNGETASDEVYQEVVDDITDRFIVDMLVAGSERLEKTHNDGLDSVAPAFSFEIQSTGPVDISIDVGSEPA